MRSPEERSYRLKPEEMEIIFDSVADGVFTVDGNFIITSFNRAAEKIMGITRDEALGRPCCESLTISERPGELRWPPTKWIP